MSYLYFDVDNILMRAPATAGIGLKFEQATASGWEQATKNPADIMEAAGVLTERQAEALAKALGVKFS